MNNRVCYSLLTVLLTPIFLLSQNSLDLNYNVELGKRKNMLWSREIKEANLGDKWFNAFYPIYYRVGEQGWKKIGRKGKNIRPFIPDTEFSVYHFKSFRRKTSLSYVALSTSMLSFMGWSVASLDYAIQNRDPSHRAFLNPRSLLFLAGFVGAYWLGVEWNSKADLDLFMAMHGDPSAPDPKEQGYSWRFGTSTSQAPGLALQLNF